MHNSSARSKQVYSLLTVSAILLFCISLFSLNGNVSTISPFGGSSPVSANSSEAEVLGPKVNTDLILYAYFETENTRKNLQFFVDHALHNKSDFIFVINGDELTVDIPKADNIEVIRRPNTCFDLGSFGEVLSANNNTLRNDYKRFVLLNGSIRGPFLPHWSRTAGVCWSDLFLNSVTEDVKLVGMSSNCNGVDPKHLQSMILSTDQAGLDLIMPGLGCAGSWRDAVYGGEVTLLSRVEEGGYTGEAIFSKTDTTAYGNLRNWWEGCTNLDIFWPGQYDGMDVHPFDTIFVKTQRLKDNGEHVSPFSEAGTRVLQTLTEWTDGNGYSSYDYCK